MLTKDLLKVYPKLQEKVMEMGDDYEVSKDVEKSEYLVFIDGVCQNPKIYRENIRKELKEENA